MGGVELVPASNLGLEFELGVDEVHGESHHDVEGSPDRSKDPVGGIEEGLIEGSIPGGDVATGHKAAKETNSKRDGEGE